MSVSVQYVAQTSSVAFGTSGARGLVSALTDRVCFSYTTGFLQHLAALGQFQSGCAVAIAGDLRPSTPRIVRACASAIIALGGKVVYAGYVPSPAVALFGLNHSIPSLMITGSHIPDDRNGIKFNRVDGELLKSDEPGILGQVINVPEGWFDGEGVLLHPIYFGEPLDVLSDYVTRYVDFFGASALVGCTVGIYEHSAVGRDVLHTIFQSLGAKTIALGRSEHFIPVDTEAVRPEDVLWAKQWAQEYSLDAIVSTDGDSDRPLLSDAQGRWLRGDVLGILTAQALSAQVVVTPVSSNTALEKTGSFASVRRTRIGSPYVIEAMNTALAEGETRVCGYEANGGFLLASDFSQDGRLLQALPTRDAVLPMVAVLVSSRQKGVSVADLVASLPARYTASNRIKDFPTARSKALLARYQTRDISALVAFEQDFGSFVGVKAQEIDTTDGVRVTFTNDEVVHLRASGNAPELRCYTEAADEYRANRLCAEVLDRLAELNAIAE